MRYILITPTWAGDLKHFELMRASLERSPLAALEHQVVVQTEDLPLFERFRSRPGLILRTTAEVLSPDVERYRCRARRLSKVLGRHITRVCGSLSRTLGWPRWPAYTGWHTQQLCKLQVAAEQPQATTIVIDSDVVITPSARVDDFHSDTGVVCLASWAPFAELSGKVRNWVTMAARLLSVELHREQPVNTYFDTPFVLDGSIVTAMLTSLERQQQALWWQVLLRQPPRRWSEFGIYKQFLAQQRERPVDWRTPEVCAYLFDTRDTDRVVTQVADLLDNPDVHYITIHSQSSGRHNWSADRYIERLLNHISEKPLRA